MTILFICNEYPPGRSGGIGSMTQTLGRALATAGQQVLVAGLYAPGYGQPDYEEDHGVKVWRKRMQVDIGIIKNNYSILDTVLLKSLGKTGILKKDMASSLNRFHLFIENIILKYKVDIVEWPDFNAWFEYLDPPIKWPALAAPLIVKFHGSQSFIRHRLNEKVAKDVFELEKEHIGRANALVAVSKDTAAGYTAFYEIKKPVQVLYNSIDLPNVQYDPLGAAPKIIFTGAMTKLKGIFSLIRAWNILHKRHPEAILEIYGKGKTSALSETANPESRPSIHYKGFVPREQLHKAMATASAAVFPSYTECFALAPLEAMSVGCPVIYTQRASGPELISSGSNGMLIDPDDPIQIASAMAHLIESAYSRKKFSVNGRKTVEEEFSIEKSLRDHLLFYKQVIQQS